MHQFSIAKLLRISEINFKLTAKYTVIPSLLCLMIIPIIRGISNLDSVHSAECLEQSVILAGIFLIVPLSLPEQSESIRETISNKKMSEWFILFIRMLTAILVLIILISAFTLIMLVCNCQFEYAKYTFGTIVSAAALGFSGLITAAISNSTIAGYLVAVGYFFSNFTENKTVKNIFFLFSMSEGDFSMKKWIFLFDLILAALILLYKKSRHYY